MVFPYWVLTDYGGFGGVKTIDFRFYVRLLTTHSNIICINMLVMLYESQKHVRSMHFSCWFFDIDHISFLILCSWVLQFGRRCEAHTGVRPSSVVQPQHMCRVFLEHMTQYPDPAGIFIGSSWCFVWFLRCCQFFYCLEKSCSDFWRISQKSSEIWRNTESGNLVWIWLPARPSGAVVTIQA